VVYHVDVSLVVADVNSLLKTLTSSLNVAIIPSVSQLSTMCYRFTPCLKKVAHHTLRNIFLVQGWPIAKISTATESEIICEHKCVINVLIFLTCQSAATWRIIVYQIGNCACTKTAHILKVSDHLFARLLLDY